MSEYMQASAGHNHDESALDMIMNLRPARVRQSWLTVSRTIIIGALGGISLAVLIPAWQLHEGRAQVSSALQFASGMKASVEASFQRAGSCGAALPASGEYVRELVVGGAVVSPISGSCTIVATLDADSIGNRIGNNTLTLIMTKDQGRYEWQCVSEVPQAYLPPACRAI